MEPKFTKNRGKIEKNTMEGPKWPLGGSQSLQKVKDDHPLGCFWLPWGSPKSTKNRSLAPKGAPGSDFLSIFLAIIVFLIFKLGFSSILDEKSMKKTCFFQAPLAFFPTWRPSRNTVFYDTKATFSFFEFLIFFF